MELLTQHRLKELLSYDAKTGVFYWRFRPRYGIAVGSVAGSTTSDNYTVIRVGGAHYKAHRLAWLYVYGHWPKNDLDHIDGNRLNNRIANLREASRSLNLENQRRARSDNRTGLLGVSKRYNGYQARIHVGGVSKHIGLFQTAEAAHAAYLKAKRELHAGCTI